MKTILACKDAHWVELETVAEAEQESHLAGHAVVYYFKQDQADPKSGANYYSLRRRVAQGATPEPLITVRIPRDPSKWNDDQPLFAGIIVVGVGNTNPYQNFARYIYALEAHLCVQLPARCYPYLG
jgi:hypothetical protein